MREVAILDQASRGNHVVRTCVDKVTRLKVAQTGDGRIAFLE